VDQNNAKTTTYEADDKAYRIQRDGNHPDGVKAETRAIPGGYRVEAAVPLRGAVTPDRRLGFDIRIRDGSRTAQPRSPATSLDVTFLSWNDNQNLQDADTSRWGTLTPVAAVRRVDAAKGTPSIDGVADPIWARAATVTTTVQVAGSGGGTATAKLLWDAGHLYVLATVSDPSLDETSANAYEQDSVEIFVDPDNSKNTGYNDDDGLYRISFSNHQTISGNFDGFAIADNLRSATRVVPGGYVVEASIQLDTIQPAAGSLLGFDLQVNDATAGARTAVHTWQDPTGLSYLNTSRWGVVRLIG
jgi:endo-1,4-beta-xylanase